MLWDDQQSTNPHFCSSHLQQTSCSTTAQVSIPIWNVILKCIIIMTIFSSEKMRRESKRGVERKLLILLLWLHHHCHQKCNNSITTCATLCTFQDKKRTRAKSWLYNKNRTCYAETSENIMSNCKQTSRKFEGTRAKKLFRFHVIFKNKNIMRYDT